MRIMPGVYQLRIWLKRSRRITIGALGSWRFPAGWYVYTGLAQRIGRHLRSRKRKHWHIDYLLAVADRVEAFVLPGTAVRECELDARLSGGEVVVPGFGSSGCGCESHLAWFCSKPTVGLMAWPEFVRHSIA